MTELSQDAIHIISEIIIGEHDDALVNIDQAITERRKSLARATALTLCPGDEVRFSDTIRPKYLIGKTATVYKVNRQSIVVSCPDDPSYGRFQGSYNVRCPNHLIEGLA